MQQTVSKYHFFSFDAIIEYILKYSPIIIHMGLEQARCTSNTGLSLPGTGIWKFPAGIIATDVYDDSWESLIIYISIHFL